MVPRSVFEPNSKGSWGTEGQGHIPKPHPESLQAGVLHLSGQQGQKKNPSRGQSETPERGQPARLSQRWCQKKLEWQGWEGGEPLRPSCWAVGWWVPVCLSFCPASCDWLSRGGGELILSPLLKGPYSITVLERWRGAVGLNRQAGVKETKAPWTCPSRKTIQGDFVFRNFSMAPVRVGQISLSLKSTPGRETMDQQ